MFVFWLTLKCLYQHYSYEYAVCLCSSWLLIVSLQAFWIQLCVMRALCVCDDLQVQQLLLLTPLWPPLPLLPLHEIPLVPLVSLCSLPWLYCVNLYCFIFTVSDAVIIGSGKQYKTFFLIMIHVVVVYHEYTLYWQIQWEEWYYYNSLLITSYIVNSYMYILLLQQSALLLG